MLCLHLDQGNAGKRPQSLPGVGRQRLQDTERYVVEPCKIQVCLGCFLYSNFINLVANSTIYSRDSLHIFFLRWLRISIRALASVALLCSPKRADVGHQLGLWISTRQNHPRLHSKTYAVATQNRAELNSFLGGKNGANFAPWRCP